MNHLFLIVAIICLIFNQVVIHKAHQQDIKDLKVVSGSVSFVRYEPPECYEITLKNVNETTWYSIKEAIRLEASNENSKNTDS